MTIPPERLVISSISTGMETYEKPFLLNNDAFPLIENALCWRKRLIKKPGSTQLGRLNRELSGTIMTLDGSGNGSANLISSFASSDAATASISLGSIDFSDGTNTYTEPSIPNGTLVGSPSGSGTINYATGAVTITGGAANAMVTGSFSYNPGLPAMGIEAFESDATATAIIDFPTNIFFDTKYAYQYLTGSGFVDTTFYKNTGASFTFSGANYQQFFSSNYFRAMFLTNNNPGAQFGKINTITKGNPTTITTTFANGLTNYDYVFLNEIAAGNPSDNIGLLNMQCFRVTVTNSMTFTVDADTSGYMANPTGGIFQYLTRQAPNNTGASANTGDGIKWYDGLGNGSTDMRGFVNFSPPLDNLSSSSTTYLVGARMVIPFGNRLLAVGTQEASSSQILNQSNGTFYGNRIRYCQVLGTPFYTQGQNSSGSDTLLPINSPPIQNQNAASAALANQSWASNIQGFGGAIDLDTTQRILSAAITQGSMILGLESQQRRMDLTGIEDFPFSLEVINPDYGSAGTYAIIPMDKGILTAGEYGLLQTSSYDSKRFDEKIIDQIFEINANNSGYERICGGRDFKNEVVYFTYVDIESDPNSIFPNQTIVFNYREGSFALWDESYTTYGLYKIASGQTWATYFTPWQDWTVEWQDLGGEQFEEPYVAGGTPQGYVMLKWGGNIADKSYNDPSLFISAVSENSDGSYTITSPNHNLSSGQYLAFWPQNASAADPNASASFNAAVSQIIDANNFVLSGGNPSLIVPGIWQMSLLDLLNVQTKQFQMGWSIAKKTRIGTQRYFLKKTTYGEFTSNLLASQSPFPINNPYQTSAIFSSIVRTRPDDSLGLNDSQENQAQIWHRLSTSVLGDTVQLQFTLSNTEMLDLNIPIAPWELHSIVLDLYPSRILA
jgi:hypothetical protein